LDAIIKKERLKALELLERHILDVMKSY
jgi:hypothetical protein